MKKSVWINRRNRKLLIYSGVYGLYGRYRIITHKRFTLRSLLKRGGFGRIKHEMSYSGRLVEYMDLSWEELKEGYVI